MPIEQSIYHRYTNDPFDRLIIATAIEHKARLASIDRLFSEYSELENCLMKIEGSD
ncbi:MAG: PIN domain-containing protein [Cyanobacteria bacterium J06555_13]